MEYTHSYETKIFFLDSHEKKFLKDSEGRDAMQVEPWASWVEARTCSSPHPETWPNFHWYQCCEGAPLRTFGKFQENETLHDYQPPEN